MQKKQLSHYELRPLEGVLLTRAHLLRQKKWHSLTEHAENRARALVRQAQTQADAIRRAARTEGYEKGIAESADIISEYFSNSQTRGQALREAIFSDVKAVLNEALAQDCAFMTVVDHWKAGGTPANQAMMLYWPESRKQQALRVVGLISGTTERPIHVVYHSGTEYQLRAGDQLLSFTPDAGAEAMATDTLNRAFSQNPFHQTDAKAKERLAEVFSGSFHTDKETGND